MTWFDMDFKYRKEVCGSSVIPALWKLKQEDSEFKAILGHTLRPCLRKPKEKRERKRKKKKKERKEGIHLAYF
jgi:hypothetical protein